MNDGHVLATLYCMNRMYMRTSFLVYDSWLKGPDTVSFLIWCITNLGRSPALFEGAEIWYTENKFKALCR